MYQGLPSLQMGVQAFSTSVSFAGHDFPVPQPGTDLVTDRLENPHVSHVEFFIGVTPAGLCFPRRKSHQSRSG